MLLTNGYIDPAELTGYVRAALADFQINQFILSRFLPNRSIDDLEYRFLSGGQGLTEAAEYRTYDAESGIGARVGLTRTSGELPPISRKYRFSEYDRLRQRQDPQLAIETGLFSDAERATRAIAARIELARGDALVNGSVTINEDGINAVADFSRPSTCIQTPANLWSDATDADPIADIISWNQAYLALNGVDIGALVMSTTIMNNLARATKLRNLVATIIGAPSILSQDAIRQTFSAYGLPPIVLYDAQVKVGSTATRIVPSNVVLMLPAPVASDDFEGTQLGGTFWGTTAESLEPEYGIEAGEQPGIVAGVYSEVDPVSLWTKAAAIALPALANASLSFVATVL